MNVGRILLCGLALIVNAEVANAKFDLAVDGKTKIWHNVSARHVQASWSGDRDEKGYATGKGTLTWYRVNRSWETGSILPESKYNSVVKYSGKMVEGKLQGPVVSVDAKGRTFHAKFEEGIRKGEWAAGPMPKKGAGSEAKTSKIASSEPDRPKPQAPKVDIPAEAPPPAPKLEQQASTKPIAEPAQSTDSSASQAADMEQHPGDSLQDLTRPPSSLRVASLGQPSPQPQAPTTETVETTAETEPMSASPSPAAASTENSLRDDDARTVAALDGEYQAAVKANDAATIDRILADDFVLVRGAGQSLTKSDMLKQARDKQATYEHHEVAPGTQKVRVWHDTAVVTETVWVKGTENSKRVDHKMSVTATYVRTPGGWRYVSSQTSMPAK